MRLGLVRSKTDRRKYFSCFESKSIKPLSLKGGGTQEGSEGGVERVREVARERLSEGRKEEGKRGIEWQMKGRRTGASREGRNERGVGRVREGWMGKVRD